MTVSSLTHMSYPAWVDVDWVSINLHSFPLCSVNQPIRRDLLVRGNTFGACLWKSQGGGCRRHCRDFCMNEPNLQWMYHDTWVPRPKTSLPKGRVAGELCKLKLEVYSDLHGKGRIWSIDICIAHLYLYLCYRVPLALLNYRWSNPAHLIHTSVPI